MEIEKWTVIVLGDTNGVVTTCVQETGDPHAAMRLTAREIHGKPGWGDMQIICAVAGDVVTIPPCEDSGKAAYVEDLKGGRG